MTNCIARSSDVKDISTILKKSMTGKVAIETLQHYGSSQTRSAYGVTIFPIAKCFSKFEDRDLS